MKKLIFIFSIYASTVVAADEITAQDSQHLDLTKVSVSSYTEIMRSKTNEMNTQEHHPEETPQSLQQKEYNAIRSINDTKKLTIDEHKHKIASLKNRIDQLEWQIIVKSENPFGGGSLYAENAHFSELTRKENDLKNMRLELNYLETHYPTEESI